MSIAAFLLGEVEESPLLSEASAGMFLGVEEQECEAYFYAGSMRLLNGDTEMAEQYFHICVETNVRLYYEYYSARAELAGLEETE